MADYQGVNCMWKQLITTLSYRVTVRILVTKQAPDITKLIMMTLKIYTLSKLNASIA